MTPKTTPSKSKATYGQTRGLSNLEMKYVGKLAIICALLKAKQAKAVFVPCKVALILYSIRFLVGLFCTHITK